MNMVFVVKKTLKCGLLDLFCPYSCRGCGELGEVLCDCCKKNIFLDKSNHCPKCGRTIIDSCCDCSLPFVATYVVGYRDELIGELAEEFKFYNIKSLGLVLAEILDNFLPEFCGDVSIVPLPTIRKHIRERGVDHTLYISSKLAHIRGYRVERILMRLMNTVQIGSDAKMRLLQAQNAFCFYGAIDKNRTYLLFDDIWTTGASMCEAAKTLKKQGAKKIVAVLLATNRFGKKPKLKY